jgi:hypothetical protein
LLLDPLSDLALRRLERLVVWRTRVPAVRPAALGECGRMLHERDALALDGPRDEGLRSAVAFAEPCEGRSQRRVVVTVDRLDLPAERAQLPREVAERDDLLRRLVGLHLVAVDHDPEPAQALVRGGLEPLPVLAFLELAVPGHDDDSPSTAESPLRERDPAPFGDAHPERARARLDPGHADVRMPVEPAEATQAKQAIAGDDAEGEERRVQPGHVVALRREEHVAVRIVEAALGDVQLFEEEVHDDVERAEGGAEVPRAGSLHGDESVQPARVREQREPGVAIDVRHAETVELGLGDETQVRHVRHETVADAFAEIRLPGARDTGVCWPPVRIEARSLRDALSWLESRVGTRRGSAAVFALALVVFGLRSIALPVIPGRDFGTYIGYYIQMWDLDSVVPMSMLFRTPLAPLVIGGTLDVFGGWGLEAVMALLFAASIVAWTRTALVFGPRAALVTAAALLLYPGYGILFHTPASEPVAAAAFAGWALAVSRAWVEPSYGRFAVVGAATAATALARPGFQVLVLVAAVPLALRLPWRMRLAYVSACAGVALAVLGSWTVANGLRYDDYTVARGSGAFFPFYRAFVTDHIVRPDNGPASRELADAVRRELLPEEPYRSYRITLQDFFTRGGAREFEDVVGITDRLWGWDSDYAHMRAVGVEAVEAHPQRYASGVGKTILEELWKPLFVALPNDDVEAPSAASKPAPAAPVPPVPSEGEDIPAAHQGFFSTTPDGHIRERWTSPVDHSLVFATQEMQRRFNETARDASALQALVPPYDGNDWLTLQFSRSSKLFPPPALWLVVGLLGLVLRRPKQSGLALALAGAAVLVVAFQALAIYTIVEFAVPVAPALVVLGAAGLVGTRTVTPSLRSREGR